MKLLTQEIKIAVVAIVAILIVYFGMMFLKNIKLSSTNNVYYIEMSDVNGLSPQAEVLANGMNIGLVKKLSFDAERQLVAIAVELNEGFQLPEGSTATLTKDMLGAPKVRIVLGADAHRVLTSGDTIPGIPMADLMSAASGMIPSVEQLLPKLDSILTALNTMVADPSIAQSLHNVEYITANLRTTTSQLNALMGNDVPRLVKHVEALSANLEQTTARVNALDYEGMVQRADATLGELQLFTNRLNNQQSTLGMLMNDASVYQNLDSTMVNASRLLEDLRLHPGRYVRFSVFGKKDK